jgi:hypothetical protein
MVEEFLSRKIFHQMIKPERLQKRNNHCLRVINIYADFSAEVGGHIEDRVLKGGHRDPPLRGPGILSCYIDKLHLFSPFTGRY